MLAVRQEFAESSFQSFPSMRSCNRFRGYCFERLSLSSEFRTSSNLKFKQTHVPNFAVPSVFPANTNPRIPKSQTPRTPHCGGESSSSLRQVDPCDPHTERSPNFHRDIETQNSNSRTILNGTKTCRPLNEKIQLLAAQSVSAKDTTRERKVTILRIKSSTIVD